MQWREIFFEQGRRAQHTKYNYLRLAKNLQAWAGARNV